MRTRIRALVTVTDDWNTKPYITLIPQATMSEVVIELPSRYCSDGVVQGQNLREDGYTCLVLSVDNPKSKALLYVGEIRESPDLEPGQFRLTYHPDGFAWLTWS